MLHAAQHHALMSLQQAPLGLVYVTAIYVRGFPQTWADCKACRILPRMLGESRACLLSCQQPSCNLQYC